MSAPSTPHFSALSLHHRSCVTRHELRKTPAAMRTFLPAVDTLLTQLSAEPNYIEARREWLSSESLALLLELRPFVLLWTWHLPKGYVLRKYSLKTNTPLQT